MADRSDLLAIHAMNSLPDNRRTEFQIAFQGMKKNRTTALVLGLFLGVFGVDRFYLGQTGLGLLKLFTLGGCYLWAIVDLFLIMGAADRKNTQSLEQLQSMYR